MDAIESGIVKIPRLPVSDTTGRPEPKYFRLWHHITERTCKPATTCPVAPTSPKPEAVYREAEAALQTLAGQWVERFGYIQEATDEKDKTPPVLIIVCDNTDIAEVFYRKISGEQEIEVVEEKGQGGKTRTVQADRLRRRRNLPRLLLQQRDFQAHMRIDTKLLAQAESADPNVSSQDAAEQLRAHRGHGRKAGRARRTGPLRGLRRDAQRGLGRQQRHPHPGRARLRQPASLRAGRGPRACGAWTTRPTARQAC